MFVSSFKLEGDKNAVVLHWDSSIVESGTAYFYMLMVMQIAAKRLVAKCVY